MPIWSRGEAAAPDPARCAKKRTAIFRRRMSVRDRRSARCSNGSPKEGRKYGVSLGPDHPAPVGSGRRRAVAVRHDHFDASQQRARSAFRGKPRCPKVARGFIDSIPRCATANASFAVRACRSRCAFYLDTLDEDKRPASSDPLFSKLWRETGGEPEMLERVVKRWRSQGR